jgi:hypothetical protein
MKPDGPLLVLGGQGARMPQNGVRAAITVDGLKPASLR